MPTVKEILDTMEYGPAPEANYHITYWLMQHEKCFCHFINDDFSAHSDVVMFDGAATNIFADLCPILGR